MMFLYRGNKLSLLASAKYGKRSFKSTQKKHQERRMNKKLKKSMKRLKHEMGEISEDQKSIKQGFKEVGEKFEEIREECAHIREEADIISRQSQSTQRRLDLMFQILRARENKDFVKATILAQSLKLLLTDDNTRQKDENCKP